jgi:mono/diheme cytochrome c family protein
MPEIKNARLPLTAVALAAGLAALAGCSSSGQVELLNRKPAEQLARETREAQSPGSVYSGWRVFQDKCARCHGPAANGTALAPDLLPRLRDMGQRRFVGLVLTRYDWSLPAGQTKGSEAQIDAVLQRQAGAVSMPAWQGEPSVTAHIVDLYAYLNARASGAQGTGQPGR